MLVGREAECAALSTALAAARAGSGGTTVVVGEPGIGKTTLLRWAAEQCEFAFVAFARGSETDAELPYAALVDLLTPLVHHLDAVSATQADVLSAAIGLGPPGGVDRFAVGVAALALLTAAAEEKPIVLVVDDLQWIDSASTDVLAFAGRRLAAASVLILASERTSGEAPVSRLAQAEILPLGPLSETESAALLAAEIAPAVAVRILDAARGNPLALVELPGLLSPRQIAGLDPLLDPISTGNGLARAFAARLAPLSVRGRRAALLAAADGSGTSSVVVGALTAAGLDDLALCEVEDAGLITLDANVLEFRHPLVRSAAYQSGDDAERRAAHAALATTEPDPDRATWHRARAALGPDEALAEELAAAGRRASERGACAAASAAFERAAAFSLDPGRRGECLLAAGTALDDLGQVARARELGDEAATLLADPLRHARAVALACSSRMALGDIGPASAAILEEAEGLAEIAPSLAAGITSLALNLPLHRLDATGALRLARRARAYGDPDRDRLMVEEMAFALSLILSGEPDGRALAIRLGRGTTDTEGWRQMSGVGWGLIWVEAYEEARAALSSACDRSRGDGLLRYLGQALHALSELDFRVGRWVSAYAHAYEAIELYAETGQRAELGFVHGTLARIDAGCGKADACRAHAQAAFDSDATFGLAVASAYANAALGLLELGSGNPAAAVASLEAVEQLAADGRLMEPWVVHWAPDLVEANIRIGDTARALEVLDGFEARARATERVSALAAAARCRGMLASSGAYRSNFEAALSFHERASAPFELARTELAYGERLRRDGRRLDARTRLQGALARFERLGAHPWAERARGELRASGQTVRSPEQRSHDELTPQEIQVAAIVAGGATNREAAAALFLSGKTIEFHLRNVYRKLGIRSRSELARAVAPAA